MNTKDSPDLGPAGRVIAATNAEDTEAFLDAFADDGVVDDWGREFVGRDQIAGWNARENMGVHSRIEVIGVREIPGGIELAIQVTGEGYNGGGAFRFEQDGSHVRRMTITG